jgi:hypothetical protein
MPWLYPVPCVLTDLQINPIPDLILMEALLERAQSFSIVMPHKRQRYAYE